MSTIFGNLGSRSVSLAVSLLLVENAMSDLALLNPSADTTLFEAAPDNNLGGSMTGVVGATSSGQAGRMLVRFDVAARVPAHATVTSAALNVSVVKVHFPPATTTVVLHRMLASWAEGSGGAGLLTGTGSPASTGDATWNKRVNSSIGWSGSAGGLGDFSSVGSGSAVLGGTGNYSFASSASMIADVQSWLDNPSSNFGWILVSQDEGTPGTAKRIGTRENPSSAPTLTVIYTLPAGVQISGKVTYGNSTLSVSGVTLSLTGDASLSTATAADGTYSFTVNAGGNYTITPSRQTDSAPNQGVTTLDIGLIRRQILGIAPLDSPYKIIAADVNGSQSVSTLDIALIRRVILGSATTFPAGLWTFVPADFNFANPLNPWPYPAARSYSQISGNQTGQDFVAIKFGDVNNSWTP